MSDRSIRVRRDHRQPSPISTVVSENPTFIAWLAPNDTKCALTSGSRKAAISLSRRASDARFSRMAITATAARCLAPGALAVRDKEVGRGCKEHVAVIAA